MNYLQMCQALSREVGASAPIGSVEDQRGEGARLCHFVAEADWNLSTLWEDWHFAWGIDQTLVLAGNAVVDDLGLSIRRVPVMDELRALDENALSWTPAGVASCRALKCLSWDEYQVRHLCVEVPPGVPSCVARRPDGALVMDARPATDGELGIAYWRYPQRLADNRDESMVPGAYQRAVVLQAKLYYAEYEDARELYQPVAAELAEWVQRLESSQLPNGGYRRRSQLPDESLLVVAM